MMTLSLNDRTKLVGILSRLSSDFDGERAAAGKLASAFLRKHGVGWEDVLATPALPPPASGHVERALWVLQHGQECLQPKQKAFLANILNIHSLSPKQAEWVDGLEAKVRGWIAGGENG